MVLKNASQAAKSAEKAGYLRMRNERAGEYFTTGEAAWKRRRGH
jgi:hypothetical protein